MADTVIIETDELRKQYDGVDALQGLTLRVPKASIFGFLGRNGAGKTTTIKILMGMAHAASGRARVFGLDVNGGDSGVAIRQRAAFVSEDKALYDSMSVDDMVRFTAAFFPRWRKDLEARYLAKFDLPAGRRIKALSGGMRTKLALLLALCRGAELLVLDEPTSSLDPAVSEEVLQTLVAHVASEELTVFFSSHQLAEVDQIADHVAIVHHGRTVVDGALDDLREQYRRIQIVFDRPAPESSWRTPGVVRTRRDGRVLSLFVSGNADRVVDEARSLNPTSVDVIPVTLKEIFLETVGTED
ncbi:MAG TPA: ABC transporter ATP-binding protein [Vicinamibacterales bacterium]